MAVAKKKAAPKKAKPAESVDELMAGLEHPLKSDIEAVRRAILGAAPEVSEGVKWNAPSFRTEKDFFATIHLRAKDQVQVVLHLGAKARPDLEVFKVADPKGLLKWLGPDRAMACLGAGRALNANKKALEAIVRAWVKYV